MPCQKSLRHYFRLVQSGAAITALYAAGMSSCDSLLASMSTVLTKDIYQRFFVTNKQDAHYVWAGRVFVVLLLIGGTLFATKVYPLFGSAYKAWQSVLSYIQFPLFASWRLEYSTRRATALPAFIGLLAGSASAFVLDRFVGPGSDTILVVVRMGQLGRRNHNRINNGLWQLLYETISGGKIKRSLLENHRRERRTKINLADGLAISGASYHWPWELA